MFAHIVYIRNRQEWKRTQFECQWASTLKVICVLSITLNKLASYHIKSWCFWFCYCHMKSFCIFCRRCLKRSILGCLLIIIVQQHSRRMMKLNKWFEVTTGLRYKSNWDREFGADKLMNRVWLTRLSRNRCSEKSSAKMQEADGESTPTQINRGAPRNTGEGKYTGEQRACPQHWNLSTFLLTKMITFLC